MDEPQDPKNNANARVIVLIYGLMKTGGPFWLFAAVKPTEYQDFLKEQKAGTIDLQNFEKYGELIIAGEGHNPPDEVTLKVAEVYQTDPAQFFKKGTTQAEIRSSLDED